MKRFLAIILSILLAFSICSCSKSNDYSNTSIAGKVTKVSGNKITLKLGTLTENTQMQPNDNQDNSNSGNNSNQTPPEKPSGDSNGNSSDNSNQAPPQMPSDNSNSNNNSNQTPPEKPSGDSNGNSSDNSNQAPPQMPNDNSNSNNDSSNNNQTPPSPPSNYSFSEGNKTTTIDLSDAKITKNSAEAKVSDITKGTILKITFDDDGKATTVEIINTNNEKPNGDNQNGASNEVSQGSSANTIDKDGSYKDKTYSSTGDDENALKVDNAKATLDGITVDKSSGSSSNTENGDFYGVNAALLATNGATVDIKNATVKSSAQNGNGVFSYGKGTTVNISNSKISTTADNSGGIQTTGGGTTNATNLTVNTKGNSSAAIRSDRGGGTVNVSGGEYTSNGYNSPAVYSTADITAKNAKLTANNSEALVIEGKNSISLTNCTVTGNMSDTKGSSSDENVHNVMIYQSMSGDAEEGTSTFKMKKGSLTSNNGDLFYITNTHCVLNLEDVKINNKDSDGYFMKVCGNSASHGWGTKGKNGAQAEFTASNQTFSGNIAVDTISTLNMTLKNNSTFSGTLNIIDNAENGTAVDNNAVVTIEKGSVWNLTGNCKITSITNKGTINFNGYTITLADGTVLK